MTARDWVISAMAIGMLFAIGAFLGGGKDSGTRCVRDDGRTFCYDDYAGTYGDR